MGHDVVVVGAGSAGAVLAARLSEDPSVDVVLVEAGPDYADPVQLPPELKYGYATAAYAETHGHLWDYEARASEHQLPTPLPRGKVVGGTSAVNGQVYLRALEDDFRLWVDAGNDVWSHDLTLPVFKRLETDRDFPDEWHGTKGPVDVRRFPRGEWLPASEAFYEACLAAGFTDCPDANRPGASGVGPIPFNNVDGMRLSTAVTHLAGARRRENLTILADTFARRLQVKHGRIVGLEIELGSAHRVIQAHEYVLCAGAIGSPLLLMRSGIGPAATLRNAGIKVVSDLPGVGRRLRDHQLVDIVSATNSAVEAPSESAPRVQIALRYTSSESPFADDMQITMRTSAPGRGDQSLVSLAPSLQYPDASGTIYPVSPDPRQPPHIDLHFLSAVNDVRRLREGIELCFELSSRPELARILGRRLAPSARKGTNSRALTRWLRTNVRTSHHCCGSCAMGPESDPLSVVDQYGRVRGTSNLRVADASIFPEIIRANPNATVMMIGERMAEFVSH